jgi:hypothetical protein
MGGLESDEEIRRVQAPVSPICMGNSGGGETLAPAAVTHQPRRVIDAVVW